MARRYEYYVRVVKKFSFYYMVRSRNKRTENTRENTRVFHAYIFFHIFTKKIWSVLVYGKTLITI